ncbi:hypothetical protein P153DRAFT_387869 [Dothidotthia symphoricarpi CBS 119687]|uniref:Uncharacterized protein n=1 Tax=Dothidotthia symphoricarpi CBS 119687 TaxID=1392245 RepID=A0A6A6A6Z3_9PLEO|nr:uncharacterized protein P153DRAFT_387869 [Dothidotthia symphoricarpi CBS 119687]KAF2127326.1 hypothetical protein P153DRAFT_387869 [Dothidotthia symphoricarpi CBS 119687]
MSGSSDTSLVILFGIFTLIATLAGLHYRDSLCCLICRSLLRAWSDEASHIDVEATAGLRGGLNRIFDSDDEAVIELQPRLSFPVYLDSSTLEIDTDGDPTSSFTVTNAPQVL